MFEFEIIDGAVTLNSYNGDDLNVVVPATYQGEPVTVIGKGAFCQNRVLKSVVLPDSIEIIENSAFWLCLSLESINFPENLSIIKMRAFVNCYGFTELEFPEKLSKIGASAFFHCNNLKKVKFNSQVKLGNDAFGGGTDLDDVNFEAITYFNFYYQEKFTRKSLAQWDDLTAIQQQDSIALINKKNNLKKSLLFSENADLIALLIREKVEISLALVNDLFEYYNSKDMVVIVAILLVYKDKNFSKKQVKSVKERKEMVEIGFEVPKLSEFRKNWVCSKMDNKIKISGYKGDETDVTLIECVADGTPIVELNYNDEYEYEPIEILRIDAKIKKIGDSAFVCCLTLREIYLPDTLEIIEQNAFSNCKFLEEITIPASVKEIGDEAFSFCQNLKKITFVGDMPKLGENVFKGTLVEKDFC